jgi:hypothetical protein
MPCDSYVIRGSCGKPQGACAYSHDPAIIRKEQGRLLDTFTVNKDAFSAFTSVSHIAEELALRVEDLYHNYDGPGDTQHDEQEHDDDFIEP